MLENKKKLLLAEDDEDIVLFEKLYFDKVFEVYTVDSGLDVYNRYLSIKPDIIVLDLMLPGKGGIDVCKEIRQVDKNIPIVAITALGTSDDKLKGYEYGFTDYITKPFEPKETVVKLDFIAEKSKLNRLSEKFSEIELDDLEDGLEKKPGIAHKKPGFITKFGDISINLDRHLILIDEKRIQLPRKEFDLFLLFVINSGVVLDRAFLLKNVWKNDGASFPVTPRAVDTCVKRLRQMLGLPTQLVNLVTVKGVGYRLDLCEDCEDK